MCDNGKEGVSQSSSIAFTKMCFCICPFRFCSFLDRRDFIVYHQCAESRNSIRNNKLQSKIFEVISHDNDNLIFSLDRLDSKMMLVRRPVIEVVNETIDGCKNKGEKKRVEGDF